MHDRSVRGGFDGECVRHRLGDEPLTLIRYHSYMNPWKGGSLSVAKPTT